jgi:hypothetical protein
VFRAKSLKAFREAWPEAEDDATSSSFSRAQTFESICNSLQYSDNKVAIFQAETMLRQIFDAHVRPKHGPGELDTKDNVRLRKDRLGL